MSGPRRDLHEGNRRSWNVATDAHNSHKGDQAAFYRVGGNKLFPEERALLGDVTGDRIIHLQCNSGQDSLSLVQLGAQVIGVDISDSAIEFARQLSGDSGVEASFVRSDVYDWLDYAATGGERFDVVFCSYGAIIWLSDLETWARGVSAILKPGGRLVVVDFHPMSMCFDDDWLLRYPYSGFGGDATVWIWEDGVGDYVALEMSQADSSADIPGVGLEEYSNPHPSYEFNWGIADVLGAVMRAGLSITEFREYRYSNSGHMAAMQQDSEGRWIPPSGTPPIPLMYGIRAEKR